ncbi:ROK family protein [Umezawaea beigongshangensis]|uniref:ROK family protein n=1 Tax=Umezawaea beigongshangensis TaxID=2780383 RepID=UPI0018F18F92|nr:ROK family protein [Umezawaea beigongshangensis]
MDRPVRRPTAVGRLLELLHLRGPLTRAEATTSLGLARSVVGDAVADLEELRLIVVRQAAPTGTAGRGRPSPLLVPAPDGPVVVAAHVGVGTARLRVVRLGGEFVGELASLPVDRAAPAERTLTALAARAAELAREAGGPWAGLAVGTGGMVRHGVVRSALHLGWTTEPVPAEELLARQLPPGVSASVAHECSLAALAERRRGAGRGAGSVLVLTCEHTGIGGALLPDGPTAVGHALEAGHLVVDDRGPQCPCGQRGCLELFADGRALLREAGVTDTGDAALVQAVLGRAARGEPGPLAAARRVAERLGIGAASLVNVLDPDVVVLTGPLKALAVLAREQLESRLADSLVARVNDTRLTVGELSEPVLLGAADLAFDVFFRAPSNALGDTTRRTRTDAD